MAHSALVEYPAEQVREWLLNEWDGRLRPREVHAAQDSDADGRSAWFFELVLPDPEGETWHADDLAELRRAVRDKALEVGLSYPWYLLPRTEQEEAVEDDADLPRPGE